MLNFLPSPVKGTLMFLLIWTNSVFWCSILFVVAFFKFIIPIDGWRKFCNVILNWISSNWISCNNLSFRLVNKIHWDVKGVDNLATDQWYLVLCNHQSWADILILQKVFNRKIPFLKFFIKKELIWVPFLGQAWWALDYPILKRYSKEFLEKNPQLKGKDIETTRVACEKFKTIPVSVMNFSEGTRFTVEKHDKQGSPYKHLLRPKAAGTAFVLAAMGDYLTSIIDVTIIYPEGRRGIWDFMCGMVPEVKVEYRSIPLSDEIIGDYFNDENFTKRFQSWLNNLWAEKDRLIDTALEAHNR